MQGVEYYYSAEEVTTLLAVKEREVTLAAASAVDSVERLTRQRVARQVRRLWIWVAVMVAGLAFTAGVVVQHQPPRRAVRRPTATSQCCGRSSRRPQVVT